SPVCPTNNNERLTAQQPSDRSPVPPRDLLFHPIHGRRLKSTPRLFLLQQHNVTSNPRRVCNIFVTRRNTLFG
ncbi:MAG: hypothetical protein ACI38R_10190, partial [Rhodococcus sp. (in: high G+C Gram-positive bacteria)]